MFRHGPQVESSCGLRPWFPKWSYATMTFAESKCSLRARTNVSFGDSKWGLPGTLRSTSCPLNNTSKFGLRALTRRASKSIFHLVRLADPQNAAFPEFSLVHTQKGHPHNKTRPGLVFQILTAGEVGPCCPFGPCVTFILAGEPNNERQKTNDWPV